VKNSTGYTLKEVMEEWARIRMPTRTAMEPTCLTAKTLELLQLSQEDLRKKPEKYQDTSLHRSMRKNFKIVSNQFNSNIFNDIINYGK